MFILPLFTDVLRCADVCVCVFVTNLFLVSVVVYSSVLVCDYCVAISAECFILNHRIDCCDYVCWCICRIPCLLSICIDGSFCCVMAGDFHTWCDGETML